jgi:CRISPR-associated endonuclease/helicase Cas3
MIIDTSFRLVGHEIPIDHSFALYSSLSRRLPTLHEAHWLGIHRITGLQLDGRTLQLTSDSRLRLRLPSEHLPLILPLAGATLRIFDSTKHYQLRLSAPEVYPLKAASDLFCSCVVIKVSSAEKTGVSPDRTMYLAALRAKLEEHEIVGDIWIDDLRDAKGRERSRRVLRIKGRSVIGYAVHISNLNEVNSIKLQSLPIFGKRRFGCSLFSPAAQTGTEKLRQQVRPVMKKPAREYEFLLAKSYPGSISGVEPPAYARLLPHLRAVERAGESIVEVAGELILQQLNLPKDPWLSRLRRAVRVSSLCHDLGKANDGFQKMVRGQLDPTRQPVRHELLSALLLTDKNQAIREWALRMLSNDSGGDDTAMLMDCVVGAVGGHHVKMDEEWRRAALALRGGCGQSLEAILDHPDLKPLLGELDCDRIRFSLVDGDQTFLGRHQLPFSMSSNRWRSNLKKNAEWWRFAAAVKALVTAADVAGSAMLPEKGRVVIRQWIHETLSNRVTKALMQEVVDARLKGDKPRTFQEAIGAANSHVTLVEAGCGSGKTAAAYMWATRHAEGKKLFFCYPTTGTATEGFLGYVHETKVEASLIHSRSVVDLEGIAQVKDEDENDHLLRIQSLNAWSPQAIICTADTVLALVRNNRRGLYNSPAILSGAFVFDELHAYDNPMFEAVVALIKALPGARFLLMTASLPKARKEFLLSNVAGIVEIPSPKDLEEIPRYTFQRLDSETEAFDGASSAFAAGKRVLWVCNTVVRAQRVLRQLQERGIAARTYHSRFKYKDRVRQHRKVIRWFGGKRKRTGIVAVTTQVAEMSLDLDADLLISEIAPIAALIQRLGRLNRRVTPEQPGGPRPALFYWPEKKRATPYTESALLLAEQWIDNLIALVRPLQQTDLSAVFNALSRQEELRLDTRTAWLDSGWFATPEPLRMPGYSVSVILSEDESACRQSNAEIVKRAIPMNYSDKIMGHWPEFKGNFIAPTGAIDYDQKTGAVLR